MRHHGGLPVADGHGCRYPVGRTGAGEDDLVDTLLTHSIQQGQRPLYIILVIFRWILDRLANGREHCEVHDGGGAISLQDTLESCQVLDVAFFKRTPLDRPMMSVHQVIVRNRFVSGQGQGLTGMTANIPGAASHKDFFHS